MSGCANATAQQPETQVSYQLGRLAEGSKLFAENVDMLEQRLSHLLRLPKADDQEMSIRPGLAMDRPALVVHAQTMATFAEIIERGNRQLADILSRLEI